MMSQCSVVTAAQPGLLASPQVSSLEEQPQLCTWQILLGLVSRGQAAARAPTTLPGGDGNHPLAKGKQVKIEESGLALPFLPS